jgi:crotonobetainyl-CoA:carnitine CoA-transferase CaiB-like acyl-CoA transferase
VPAVVVNDVASLIVEPHVVARGSVTSVDGTTMPAPVPKLSATPGSIAHVGPALGEATAAVVTEWLDGRTA